MGEENNELLKSIMERLETIYSKLFLGNGDSITTKIAKLEEFKQQVIENAKVCKLNFKLDIKKLYRLQYITILFLILLGASHIDKLEPILKVLGKMF